MNGTGFRLYINLAQSLRALQAAEKPIWRCKKCQGTTSVVPQVAENKKGL
jgi:hypothetical protein